MQWHSVLHILGVDLVQFTLIMLAALVMREPSLTVLEALLSIVPLVTQRMQEYDVKVC